MKTHAILTATSLALAACSSVADMAGYDTASLNQAAAKQYRETIKIMDGRYRLDTESQTAQRIQAIFQRMRPLAEAANHTGVPFNWQMSVIKSNDPNAWALPGGKMAVNTAMVDKLGLSDDEIAAVIGHEMTHALREDGKKAAGGRLLQQLAGRTIGIAVQATTGFSGNFASLGADILGEYGLSRPYSRAQESYADKGGMILMAQAGYDPRAAISVWEKMVRYHNQVGRDNQNTSLISNHPSDQARIDNLRSYLPNVVPLYHPYTVR